MSILRFNNIDPTNPTNHQVTDHIFYDSEEKRYYKLVETIGYWDYNNTAPVYKGNVIPNEKCSDCSFTAKSSVSMKVCNKFLEPEYYELARKDADRSYYVRHGNILPTFPTFYDANCKELFCIPLVESPVVNLRTLMLSSGMGLPEDCIAIALKSVLLGLKHIHSHGELHRQITGSNIVYIDNSIRITFAASAYVRADTPDLNVASVSQPVQDSKFLPYRDILKWGRAPEVLEADQEKYKTAGYSIKSDIWQIGITALEYAYGGIEILSRRELLDIAKCISVTEKMASNWEEQIRQTEDFVLEEIMNECPKPPKGKQQKIAEIFIKWLSKMAKIGEGKNEGIVGNEKTFSKDFVKLVAKCLNDDPERRPTAEKLLDFMFLKKAKPIQYFKDAMVIQGLCQLIRW